MEGESIMKFVMEKLKELLVLLENFGGFLVEELEKVFPADSREEKVRHWIQVATPFLILGVAVVLLYCCFRCCCRFCCGRGSAGAMKMMKAPGRGGGHLIPRTVFESDPSAYFRALHADCR